MSPEFFSEFLFTLIHAIERSRHIRTNNTNRSPKAGQPWNDEEDQRLQAAFQQGQAVPQLARAHQRTVRAVEARLVRLGLMEQRWEGR